MIAQKTLILGIGNTLLGDEGAGIRALELLRSEYPSLHDVTYLDGGTLSFSLAHYIEDCDRLIVFDAAELKAPAGAVKTLIGESMDRFLGMKKRSPHEVGLIDLIDISRITDALPEKRALIGIQPGDISWNTELSSSVQASLETAVTSALGILQIWDIIDRNHERDPEYQARVDANTADTSDNRHDKSISFFHRKAV